MPMNYDIGKGWLISSILAGGVAWFLSGNLSFGMAMVAALLLPEVMKIYLPYANNNPQHLWFKRKLYGWGWTPVTWEGWLSMIIYMASVAIVFRWVGAYSHTANDIVYKAFIPIAALTAGLIYLCYKKGEKPQWQWGELSNNK